MRAPALATNRVAHAPLRPPNTQIMVPRDGEVGVACLAGSDSLVHVDLTAGLLDAPRLSVGEGLDVAVHRVL